MEKMFSDFPSKVLCRLSFNAVISNEQTPSASLLLKRLVVTELPLVSNRTGLSGLSVNPASHEG